MKARVTIGAMMGVIAVIGVGFASLRSPTALWSSGLFTLAFLATIFAAIAAVATRERVRSATAGFALGCGSYLAAIFGPMAEVNGVSAPPFLQTSLILQQHVLAPPRFVDGPQVENLFTGENRFLYVDPPLGSGFAEPTGPTEMVPPPYPGPVPPPRPVSLFPVHRVRVAHVWAALVLGVFGAGLGRLLSGVGGSKRDASSMTA